MVQSVTGQYRSSRLVDVGHCHSWRKCRDGRLLRFGDCPVDANSFCRRRPKHDRPREVDAVSAVDTAKVQHDQVAGAHRAVRGPPVGQRRARARRHNRIKCWPGEAGPPQAGLEGLRHVLLALARRQVGNHSQGHGRNTPRSLAHPFDLPLVFDQAPALNHVLRRDQRPVRPPSGRQCARQPPLTLHREVSRLDSCGGSTGHDQRRQRLVIGLLDDDQVERAAGGHCGGDFGVSPVGDQDHTVGLDHGTGRRAVKAGQPCDVGWRGDQQTRDAGLGHQRAGRGVSDRERWAVSGAGHDRQQRARGSARAAG